MHVGSQQMTAEAWQRAIDDLTDRRALNGRGTSLDGSTSAAACPRSAASTGAGRPLDPPLDKIFAVLREGMERLRAESASPLVFVWSRVVTWSPTTARSGRGSPGCRRGAGTTERASTGCI